MRPKIQDSGEFPYLCKYSHIMMQLKRVYMGCAVKYSVHMPLFDDSMAEYII